MPPALPPAVSLGERLENFLTQRPTQHRCALAATVGTVVGIGLVATAVLVPWAGLVMTGALVLTGLIVAGALLVEWHRRRSTRLVRPREPVTQACRHVANALAGRPPLALQAPRVAALYAAWQAIEYDVACFGR